MAVRILTGDCRALLPTLPDRSVDCCVTSPPYFGLRDYGVEGQLGLEPTPDEFVAAMVAVFREVRRVLRDDGTLWLNLGDSYAGSWGAQSRGGAPSDKSTLAGNGHSAGGPKTKSLSAVQIAAAPKKQSRTGSIPQGSGLKPKDLIGIPWRVAFALQADGWWLRSDIVWHKPNPMPESVTDRPTNAHEHVFLLTKSPRYYYDLDAVREPLAESSVARIAQDTAGQTGSARADRPMKAVLARNSFRRASSKRGEPLTPDARCGTHRPDRPDTETDLRGRNARNVWTVATQPFTEAHFATMPPELAERCIKAGCPRGGVVLDPFGGAGTTGLAADRLQRDAILLELNPEYAALAERRIAADGGMFGAVEKLEAAE